MRSVECRPGSESSALVALNQSERATTTADITQQRAYERTEERLRAQGGRVNRVVLDYGRWTIELANTERLEAIAAFGFTERQARFLLNVLPHSGVFIERQYCSFAGIVHGQKSTDFIKTPRRWLAIREGK